MNCQTNKSNKDCFFMGKSSCTYINNKCEPIIEKCIGCDNIEEYNNIKYCTSYPSPAIKWKLGNCNFATHIIEEPKEKGKKLNALKASKRKAKGK